MTVLLAALGAVGLWAQSRSDRNRAEAQLVEQARTLAWLVDREFERTLDTARLLAASDALARRDLDALSRDMRAASTLLSAGLPEGTLPVRISLVDVEGVRTLDTRAPDGRGGGRRAMPHAIEAIASGTPQVSGVFTGPPDAIPDIAVAVPVLASGPDAAGRTPTVGAIGVTVPRARLVAIVSEPGLAPGGIATVHDRSGTTVARSVRDAETVGSMPNPAVLAAMLGAEGARTLPQARTLEGEPAMVAVARAPRSGYLVRLDIPERVALAPIRASLIRSAVLGVAALTLAVVVALLMARSIVAAIGRVPAAAAAAARGEPPVALGLREADELAASLAATLAERERAAADARALFENSPVGVAISDMGGRVHAANDAFLALIGRDRTEFEAKPPRWDLMTPEEWLPRDEAASAEAVAVGKCTPFEKEYLRPDGVRVPVLVSLGLIDRASGLTASFVIDLSERKAAERALRESEARFRSLADAMPQLVWSARPDGSPDYSNARWREFFGSAAGMPLQAVWREAIHPDDLQGVRERWRRSLRTGSPYETECRLRRHDGAYVSVLARALSVRDAAGRVTRWFGTCTDITDIVAAREVMARRKVEMERLAAERARELDDTQLRLAQAQRVEALGHLAGGIAHDVNNVLQAVRSGAGLLLRSPEDRDDVRRLASMIGEAAGRGAAVTHRLLAFSRGGELRAEAIDAAAILEGLREMLARTLGAAIEVRIEVPPGLPPLRADPGQLETVLVNLATNARDAMPSGGRLTFAAALDAAGSRMVRLSACDTGVGMDEATLARAREPFFTTKEAGKGTGLGLAMAKDFAEGSGGSLDVESEPGRGTVVTIRLPVTAVPPGAQGLSPVSVPSRAAVLGRVLLVDDEDLVRESVAEELAAIGHDVRAVASAAEALALLDAGDAIDILMSDLSMPGMDGMTLIREARSRRPGVPAVLLTGTDPGDLAREDAGGSMVLLLRKPIGSERLAESVAALLEARSC